MTRMMNVMQVPAAGQPFELVQRPIPEPGPGQVRVKVAACGICHSDAFVREGGFPGVSYPRVPGHEVAGQIDALGAGVSGWRAGDRVGIGWFGGHCHVCAQCRRGDFMNCRQGQICGISYDGGYGDYMVAPADALARIPDDLAMVEAAPLLCAGVTTFNALRHAGARPGDLVAIQGIGGLGHLAVQFAKKMGFRTAALTRGADKEPLARQLGADIVIDSEVVDPAKALLDLGGADVILATAPSSSAMASVVKGLSPRGHLVIVGASMEPMSVIPVMLLSGRSISGWPSGTAADSEETLSFSQLSHVAAMIETAPLADAEAAYQRMMANKARFRIVLTL